MNVKVRVFIAVNLVFDASISAVFVEMGMAILEPHGLQEGLLVAAPTIIVIALGCITRILSFKGGRYAWLVGALTYVLPILVFPVTVALVVRDGALITEPLLGAIICSMAAFTAVGITNSILSRGR